MSIFHVNNSPDFDLPQLDVINSIQMLFQVQEEYVAALLSMATNLVSLHSQIGAKPVVDILTLLDEFLF